MKFDVYFRKEKADWETQICASMKEALDFSKSLNEEYETLMYQHVEVDMFVLNTKTSEVRTVKEVKYNTVILNQNVDDALVQRNVKAWCKKDKEWYREDIMVVEEVDYVCSSKIEGDYVKLSTDNTSITISVNNPTQKEQKKETTNLKLDPLSMRRYNSRRYRDGRWI